MKSFEKFNTAKERNNSILCVGLDSDIDKLPAGLSRDICGLVQFNRSIIEATKDLVCAYKINFAFYEQYGIEGIEALKKTFEYIPDNIFTIADAKRGDIGNTSKSYAVSCFDYFGADSITVNPYMGYDSVSPFLDYKDKFVFLLGLTSNKGSEDFQKKISEGRPVYRQVIDESSKWAPADNLGYVIGATHPSELSELRETSSDRLFLIPGVGAQGGDIEAIIRANGQSPATINVSRAVIFASADEGYQESVRAKALEYKNEFNKYL